jgi:hypothetical protein
VSARGCQSRRVGPSPIDRSAAPSGAAGQSTSCKHAGNHVATSDPKPRWARRTRARDQVVGRDCNPRRVGAVPTVLSIALVAQTEGHRPSKPTDAGSNPAGRTVSISPSWRIPGSGLRSRLSAFDSRRRDHLFASGPGGGPSKPAYECSTHSEEAKIISSPVDPAPSLRSLVAEVRFLSRRLVRHAPYAGPAGTPSKSHKLG